MINNLKNYKEISKAVRKNCGATGKSFPIVVIDGFAEPLVYGESFYYTNKMGQRIYHPSAYAKKGWSSLVYKPSTTHIKVGAGWLISNGLV